MRIIAIIIQQSNRKLSPKRKGIILVGMFLVTNIRRPNTYGFKSKGYLLFISEESSSRPSQRLFSGSTLLEFEKQQQQQQQQNNVRAWFSIFNIILIFRHVTVSWAVSHKMYISTPNIRPLHPYFRQEDQDHSKKISLNTQPFCQKPKYYPEGPWTFPSYI